MSNKFVIFSNQAEDGDSEIFKVSPRDSVGVNDTEHSAYLEIFTGASGLGGGTLELHRKCQDGTFRNSEAETSEINSNFPSDETAVLIISMNYKDETEWKFVLSGSTTPSLTITGINMQGA